MCMPGERLYFTHIFSRLLVYLTFLFLFTSTLNKKKRQGDSIFFDFFFRNCRNTSSRMTADLPSVPRVEMGREG